MALAYGKPTGGYDDPNVVAVIRCLGRLGVAIRPGVWKVDFYPWLRYDSIPHLIHATYVSRYVPGYLKELQDGHAEELALFRKHLEDVRQQIVRSWFIFLLTSTF